MCLFTDGKGRHCHACWRHLSLRKTAFCKLKDGILGRKRPSFTLQLAFKEAAKGDLATCEILFYGLLSTFLD